MIDQVGLRICRARTPETHAIDFVWREETSLGTLTVPPDLDNVLEEAWNAARRVPGFLVENEARLLGTLVACLPRTGAIVEIGSFKGRSTVMLAKVSQRYSLGSIVAIDPHNFNSVELKEHRTSSDASSFEEFAENLEAAGVSGIVDIRRALSTAVIPEWNSPIRLLWIDGDHTYQGAKADFDGFVPHLVPHGVVAFHDALHDFPGPIRVFVEEVLRSSLFGAAGFTNSIAWSQFRPEDGAHFQSARQALERVASPLIPLTTEGPGLRGLQKLRYKLRRSRVPRRAIQPSLLASMLDAE